MIDLKIVDEREENVPPLNPEDLKIMPVLEASGIACSDTNPLKLTVFLHNQPLDDVKLLPTSNPHPCNEALTEWHIHLVLLPKEELTFGTIRAISRAVSRDIFMIQRFHDYGDWLVANASPEAMLEEQTAFADSAPWALS